MSDDAGTVAWVLSLPVAPPSAIPRNEWVVVNGKAGTRFDEINQTSVRLSADGKHLAYAGLIGRPGDLQTRSRMVVDGRPSKPYRSAGDSAFSPDGNHLAYGITREDYAQCYVVDGRESEPFEHATPVVFTPDSQHWAFASMGVGRKGWRLVLDGKQIAGDDAHALYPVSVAISPDGTRVALVARGQEPDTNGSFFVVADGVVGPPFRDIGSPLFSDDSKHLVYSAGNPGGDYTLFEDGQPGPTYNFIFPDTVRFVPGGRLAFVAGTGTCDGSQHVGTTRDNRPVPSGVPTLVVDGKPLASPVNAVAPVFSSDGRRLAYHGQALHPSGRGFVKCVFVDGKADPPTNRVSFLQFSPDGTHYAYVATASPGDERQTLVIDGTPHLLRDVYVLRMTLDNAGAVTAVLDNTHGVYRRVLLKQPATP